MIELYKTIPKDYTKNLLYRLELRERAAKEPKFREAVRAACSRDVLFFFNSLCWLYEPRLRHMPDGTPLPKKIPFITWPHQDPAFLEVKRNLGTRDVVVEKCRAEGFSWALCLLALHSWLFEAGAKVGLVSSTEAKSDDPGNMGSMGAKIDWELACLPKWLVGKQGGRRGDSDWYRNLGDHSFVNNRTGAQINLFAAGPDTGRGDRFTWFGLDEHAANEWKKEQKDEKVLEALSATTESRVFVSTPNGTDGAFYRVVHEPSNRAFITVDWRQNPTKNRGLYKMVKDVPVAVDPENNPLPPDYDPPSQEIKDLFSRLVRKGFQLDRSTRSPWYDDECDRAGNTPQSIAKEQDRDYGGSMYRVFGTDFMDHAEKHVKPPVVRGNLVVSDDLTSTFDRDEHGPFMLWCPLDVEGKPPMRDYIVCADVGAGQGGSFSSNSVLIVIDVKTREQVLEYATNTTRPDKFADIAVAICHWFYGAHLAWEDMGPGVGFKAQVINHEYSNCFYRMVQTGVGNKKSPKLGFINRNDARTELFSDMHNAVCTGDLIVRSKWLLEEFPQYVWEKGKIEHVGGKSATDDSFGAAHGDRVIAFGVGYQALKTRPVSTNKKNVGDKSDEPAYGSLAWRRWFSLPKKTDGVWDKRTMADYAKKNVE